MLTQSIYINIFFILLNLFFIKHSLLTCITALINVKMEGEGEGKFLLLGVCRLKGTVCQIFKI